MNPSLKIILLTFVSAFQCSCVSALMTAGTGIYPGKLVGKTRTRAISKLGPPKETNHSVPAALKKHSFLDPKEAVRVDRFEYKGKVNGPDEGVGNGFGAIFTLGASEVIAIPLTTADIVARSFGEHQIYLFYDGEEKVTDCIVDPRLTR